jgi:hypothetical protein
MSLRRLACLALAVALPGAAAAQSLEEIVARNVEARGGLEAWRAVQSLRLQGSMDVGQGMKVPFVMEMARPRRMRLEYAFDGQQVVETFDGTRGYRLRPFVGAGAPEALTDAELRETATQAELDGPLVDYVAKGHQIELQGQEKVEGRDAWRIEVRFTGGGVRWLLIDAQSGLELKAEAEKLVRGKTRRVETFFRDYRPVGGVLVPRRLETRLQGVPRTQALAIDSVTVNVPIAAERFGVPTAGGTPAVPNPARGAGSR